MIAAIVPAAGRSVRMGRPKLLISIQGETIIRRVVTTLREGGADTVVVIAPPADAAESPELAAEARRAGALVVVPAARPAEMRDSMELGIETLGRSAPPRRVLIAPGDSPGITREVVARLLDLAAGSPESIVIPCFEGRRGHPIVLPWSLAAAMRALPADVGLNALVARNQDRVVLLPVDDSRVIADMDTPQDLNRWHAGALTDAAMEGGRSPDRLARPGSAGLPRVRVRLFALAKERAGRSEIDIELAEAATVASLRAALAEQLPALAPLLGSVLIAVNEEYAADDQPIPAGARIAVIPPVSGGGEVCGPCARVPAN